jgi:hypothetical protein
MVDHDVMLRRAALFASSVAALGCSGCGTPTFGATAEPLGVLPQASSVQGRDGGGSGLAFGHSVWTYGDTVLQNADAAGVTWHQNSWSFTEDRVVRGNIGGFTERTDSAGAPTYFVAPTPDEAAYNTAHYGDSCAQKPCGARWAAWPGPPLWDAARGRALAFYGLVHAAPGDFNFYGVGQGIAVWNDFASPPERPEVSPGAEHPTLLFGQGEPAWGEGALLEGAELYSLACDTDAGGLSPPCWLARVPAASALDRSAWTFWNGKAWSTSMSDRAAVFTGAPTVTLEHNAYLGAYTALYAEPMSTHVVLRTAPAITGPWSDAKLLFEADKPEGGAYDAASHPEYEEQNGKVLYVTFSRSNHKAWFGSEFALVRVTLPAP